MRHIRNQHKFCARAEASQSESGKTNLPEFAENQGDVDAKYSRAASAYKKRGGSIEHGQGDQISYTIDYQWNQSTRRRNCPQAVSGITGPRSPAE